MLLSVDQLMITVEPDELVIGKGTNATFTAMASGINTSENNFMYQWRKRDSDSLPDKVSGATENVLTIPNITESDEGQYYCNVTNEWDTSVRSNDVTLSIFGMSNNNELYLLNAIICYISLYININIDYLILLLFVL